MRFCWQKRPWLRLVVAVAVALALLGASQAATSAEPLQDEKLKCENHLEQLKARIKRATLVGGVLSIVGAVVASLGSLAAGFSNLRRARRVSAIVGVAGAALAAAPKLFDDREQLIREQIATEEHWTAGHKVYIQLGFISKPELITKAKQYAASRFVDCQKTEPPKEVPDVNEFLGIGTIIAMMGPDLETTPLVLAKGQLTRPDGGSIAGENLRISLSLDSGTADYLVQGDNVILQDESLFGEDGLTTDGGTAYVVRKGYVFQMDGGVVQGDRFILDLSHEVKALRVPYTGATGPQVRASFMVEDVDPNLLPKIIVIPPDKKDQ
jgi:hypothetical protein